MELRMIRRAMESAGANQSAAARLLGITRDQLRYRLKRYREEGLWADAPHGDEEEAGGQGPGTPGG
jgi:transposase-like protein